MNDSKGLGIVQGLTQDVAACIRFFSRIPVPALGKADDPCRAPDFQRLAKVIPIAGVVIALLPALFMLLLSASNLPSFVIAGVVVSVSVASMGCLHEDGLSDVCDGFFGGHTKELRLEIMKDSRIGAFGAAALILSLGLRWGLLTALLERYSPLFAILVFLASELFSRFAFVALWQKLPAAYEGGLSQKFGKPDASGVLQAGLITVLPLLLFLFSPSGGNLIASLVVGGITTWCLARLTMKKIGGVTGDVLGAAQQLSSLGFLIGWLLI
ncbi:adenosylcobinamide-GDP ribazoletransferase [Flexibacterium corallicola]|uniref:adenosylcobinamide-GDP ribazoletransferase n=1 Tax=Flexibacterium corallicola TaxID=3037259 RepID=UPI00286F9114|nr:adenosylcobinamide-GDP ribazoletransferase [Pseudovibrio sp. M1P-2-3]